MTQELRKAGANWVDGDRFFDRESELKGLMERVQDGTHTLLTAQRRMGKTSLVRELLCHLNDAEEYETVFVDLERAETASDAIAELGRSGPVRPNRWTQNPGCIRQCPAESDSARGRDKPLRNENKIARRAQ